MDGCTGEMATTKNDVVWAEFYFWLIYSLFVAIISSFNFNSMNTLIPANFLYDPA
jgi:hypothetical protein